MFLSKSLVPGRPAFERARLREDCRRSLTKFCIAAWPLIVPKKLVANWHIGAVSEHLQAVTEGQIYKLIINIPPGTGKSTLASVFWPAWEWIDHPAEQSLFGSYDDTLAVRDSERCRQVLDSQWYQETFRPEWSFSKKQNAKSFYVNTLNGNRYTFGMNGGSQTGWRGDKVVIDDPNNVAHQYDARIKAASYERFASVISTRVNDIANAKFVIIQQRMATDDMTGCLLKQNEKAKEMTSYIDEFSPMEWIHLKLPMERGKSPCVTVSGDFSWKDPRPNEGDLLFPELFPRGAMEHMKHVVVGRNGYAGQYQQEPVPEGGARFNSADFQHWYSRGWGVIELHRRAGVKEIIHLRDCWTFVTCDLAASEEQQADFTVFSIWAVTHRGELILLDRLRGQWTEPTTVNTAVDIYAKPGHNGAQHSCFVVEQNGLGLPIAQAMSARGLPVMFVSIHRTDKFSRTATAAIRLEAGQVFWPDPATPWYSEPNEGWEIEHLRFPGFAHDDQVDTFSLAAEAVYKANIFNIDETILLDVKSKEAVSMLTRGGKEETEEFKHMAKKFFARR